MKRIITASLVATLALTSAQAASNAELASKLSSLESELAKVKKDMAKQKVVLNDVKAHDSGDNIKWGADLRTAYDNLNYDMANGTSVGKDSLYSLRLWLNMAYAPNENNVFKGQLSMNKAFGASFDNPMNRIFDAFDWTSNESLTDNTLKVRQAYWLYLGDKAFGADIPWTMSVGRRPSVNGFLANLSQDDAEASPLGHLINVEFDGLSSKLDFSKVTGVPGLSFKVCLGYGSTNAVPLIGSATPNADVEQNGLDDIKLGGFIFEPYNDGQYIVKTTWFRAFDLPDINLDAMGAVNPFAPQLMTQVGDMDGAGISVLIDGITEDGYFADAKVFGSYSWTKSNPNGAGALFPAGDGVNTFASTGMLGSTESETGTSYWFGAYLPVTDGEDNFGTIGMEYNHGSQYWRPFTYAEDTMIGSKIAARGDAWELNYTYQINEALSVQARYVDISYDYTGSNGFFGNTSGSAMKIDDVKEGAAAWTQLGGTQDPASANTVVGNLMMSGLSQDQAIAAATQMGMAANMLPQIVEAAQDFRLYLRYRF